MTSLIFNVILIWFRKFAYALITDIQKAFLYINIGKVDLQFNNVFLNELTIVRNQFLKVVFGLTSSPFSLNG